MGRAVRAKIKQRLWQAGSLALAVAILAVLLGRQRWADVARTLRSVRAGWLAWAVGLSAAYWLVRTARWRWMASLEHTPLSWPRALLSMLAGLGVGLITPLRSGEVVRPLFVPRGARLRLAGWVLVERALDLSAVVALCILGIFYMVFAGGAKLVGGATIPAWVLLICPLLLVVALAVPLLIHYRPAGLWRTLRRVLPGKARELAEVRLSRREFAVFLSVGLLAELLSVLSVYVCLRAYGRIDLLTACALAPIVMLHNLLPATPGGFGVRETLAVVIFGSLDLPGLTETAVLAAYLTNPIVLLVAPGAVGVVWAWVAGAARRARINPPA